MHKFMGPNVPQSLTDQDHGKFVALANNVSNISPSKAKFLLDWKAS
jgi:hypothetical protein